MNFTKLSRTEKGRHCVLRRVYEQWIASEQDIREVCTHLVCEMIKANREGRELIIEFWTESKQSEGIHASS